VLSLGLDDESADVIGVGGWFDSGVDLAEAVLMQ
jgi:hypothetical protein